MALPWFGHPKLEVNLKCVAVEIEPELLLAVRNDVIEFLSGNEVATKRLRTFAGREVHVCSLVMFWTPSV